MKDYRTNFKMNNDGSVTINGGTFDKISSFSFDGTRTPWPTVTLTFDVDGDFIVDLRDLTNAPEKEEKNNETYDA